MYPKLLRWSLDIDYCFKKIKDEVVQLVQHIIILLFFKLNIGFIEFSSLFQLLLALIYCLDRVAGLRLPSKINGLWL